MSWLGRTAERLARPDAFQLLLLTLALLAGVVAIYWPLAGGANETWYVLTQVRAGALALLALGFGTAAPRAARAEAAATARALVVVALLTSPLEVAAHAATLPSTPLAWPLALAPIDTLAFFGVGAVLGATFRFLRAVALLPLAVPALLVGTAVLDARLGLPLTNPVTASLRPSLEHALLGAALALATAAWLARRPAGDAS